MAEEIKKPARFTYFKIAIGLAAFYIVLFIIFSFIRIYTENPNPTVSGIGKVLSWTFSPFWFLYKWVLSKTKPTTLDVILALIITALFYGALISYGLKRIFSPKKKAPENN